MSESLEVGSKIKTLFNGEATVLEFIAEGGQGAVYRVMYKGEEKALKWYKKGSLGNNPNAFYDNIKQNIMNGKPSDEFLWPQDITEWKDETFGYVMDLRTAGYEDITQFMLTKVRFSSYKAIINAALGIVSAFRILHNAGYSYQDLNDGNFFINPRNGKVLICDNDNVAPDGKETGIIGKPRYMAPEIVLEKNKPNSLSDRFSMSIILYILFCLNHPLEGKRYLVPALTPEHQKKLYGSEPLFMMDPNYSSSDDNPNGPHPVIHKNSIMVWQYLPDYMKDIFIRSFSQEACVKPSVRPKEIEWLKALTRFRSEIVSCTCGNEIFTKEHQICRCDCCGKIIPIPFKLFLSEYSIPAVKDSRIYRCQLGVCNEKDALSPVAHVLEKKDSPGVLGIKNRSENSWDAVTSKGAAKRVAPNDVVPLKDGIEFTVFGSTVSIKSNN